MDHHVDVPNNLRYSDLSEALPDDRVPVLDRVILPGWAGPFTSDQLHWRNHGYVKLENFLPDDLITSYRTAWLNHHVKEIVSDRSSGLLKIEYGHINVGGWKSPTPYMHVKELRDLALYPPLMEKMRELIGEEMGLHLNLTGWVSTERKWHQDDYLNPDFVNSYYAAVWMALDDVDPDAGPFQFVPGSHRWPVIRRHKLFEYLTPEEQAAPDWPSFTQDWVAKVCMEEVEARGGEVHTYLPKKGDVLIWHGRLIHQGSKPKNEGLLRRALINHYSALSVRTDMPNRAQYGRSWYFVHPGELV